ncbi:MAG: hypothetical protein ACRCVL_03935, partial [Cetobacterium sp.]
MIRIKAGGNLIWCGDFNAHNSLWGSTCTDKNGRVVEEFMEEHALVCLNNGKGTRFNIRDSSMSCIDLTIVSGPIALECKWEVLEQSTLGSDHYPILCSVGLEICQQSKTMASRWRFDKADWDKFNRLCIDGMVNHSLDGDIDVCSDRLTSIIINAAEESIPKAKGKVRLKIVPWWNDECTKAAKVRNKAFRELRKTLIPITLISYQKKRAQARKIIKQAKRKYWQSFCSTIGRETRIGEVWGVLKKMAGVYRTQNIPVLVDEGKTAVTQEDKAEMLASTFQKAHSSDNLGINYKRRREEIIRQNRDIYNKKTASETALDAAFNLWELKRVLMRVRSTAPGKDRICYIMIKRMDVVILKVLLALFNKIWREGHLPLSWKQAMVIPIHKPGKDATVAGNYRPIALTSNLCKIMEKMIVNRLYYVLESKGLMAP